MSKFSTKSTRRVNSKYNWICVPLEKNKDTGMYSIDYNAIGNNKDFLFCQPVNGVFQSFVVSYQYVTDHLQWLHYKRKDEITGEYKYGQFPAISWEDLESAPKVKSGKKS